MAGSELKTSSFQQIRRQARRRARSTRASPQIADESILPVPNAPVSRRPAGDSSGPHPRRLCLRPTGTLSRSGLASACGAEQSSWQLSRHRPPSIFLLGVEQNFPSTHPMYAPLDAPNGRHLIPSTISASESRTMPNIKSSLRGNTSTCSTLQTVWADSGLG
jgi:hypothetical protein